MMGVGFLSKLGEEDKKEEKRWKEVVWLGWCLVMALLLTWLPLFLVWLLFTGVI